MDSSSSVRRQWPMFRDSWTEHRNNRASQALRWIFPSSYSAFQRSSENFSPPEAPNSIRSKRTSPSDRDIVMGIGWFEDRWDSWGNARERRTGIDGDEPGP